MQNYAPFHILRYLCSPSSSPVAAWTTSHPPGECTRIPTWVSLFPPNSVTKRLSKLVPVLNMRSPDSHATESESDTEDGTIRWRQEQKTIPVTRKHTFFIKRRVWLSATDRFWNQALNPPNRSSGHWYLAPYTDDIASYKFLFSTVDLLKTNEVNNFSRTFSPRILVSIQKLEVKEVEE